MSRSKKAPMPAERDQRKVLASFRRRKIKSGAPVNIFSEWITDEVTNVR